VICDSPQRSRIFLDSPPPLSFRTLLVDTWEKVLVPRHAAFPYATRQLGLGGRGRGRGKLTRGQRTSASSRSSRPRPCERSPQASLFDDRTTAHRPMNPALMDKRLKTAWIAFRDAHRHPRRPRSGAWCVVRSLPRGHGRRIAGGPQNASAAAPESNRERDDDQGPPNCSAFIRPPNCSR